MNNRIKILLLLVVLTFTTSIISNTYSRYVADTEGNVQMEFAKWQILVNNSDITSNTNSEIMLAPVLDYNENIKENTIAPTSSGYFDITINPSNVDLSFDYNITLDLLNENMPDLLITNYSFIDANYDEEKDTLTKNTIENNTISGTFNYENGKIFENFTIRIYFEWYDGEDNQMNDEADTLIATTQDSLQIQANIEFRQKIK